MEEALFLLLRGLALGWFLAYFEPIQELVKYITKKWNDKYFTLFYLKTALSCFKCLSFWSTLAFSGNVFLAIGAAFIALTITKIWKI